MPIESISETKISFQFKRQSWLINKGSSDPAKIENWGGISGAGVFMIRGLYPELAAITFEYNEAFELLYCTRTDFINYDGTIRH